MNAGLLLIVPQVINHRQLKNDEEILVTLFRRGLLESNADIALALLNVQVE
jgi:hypothetical protein